MKIGPIFILKNKCKPVLQCSSKMVFEEMIIIFNVELVSSFHNVEYIFRYVKLKSIITQRVPQVKVMSDYPAKNTGLSGINNRT